MVIGEEDGLVGARGWVVAGWGPCACPGDPIFSGGISSPIGEERGTRASARPPHPHHATPCPYQSPVLLFGVQNSSGCYLAKLSMCISASVERYNAYGCHGC